MHRRIVAKDAIKDAKDAKNAKSANPWRLALLALLGRAEGLIGAEAGGVPQQIVAEDARATIFRRAPLDAANWRYCVSLSMTALL